MLKITRLLIGLIAFCALGLLVTCTQREFNDDWIDNGVSYVCSDCYAAMTLPCMGSCILCNAEIGTISYKYCYDCAKALNRCQMCTAKRY